MLFIVAEIIHLNQSLGCTDNSHVSFFRDSNKGTHPLKADPSESENCSV